MTLKDNIKSQEKGAEMGSLLRSVKKREKARRLGEVEIVRREEYALLPSSPQRFEATED
jgi:hypothetical protein